MRACSHGWRLVAVASALVGAGCVGDADWQPPLPVMRPAPAVGAAPVASAADVIAEANARVGRDDFAGIVRELARLPATERATATRELVTQLAASDPARAGRLAVELSAGPIQTDAVEQTARAWIERDLEAAVTWALGISSPAARIDAIRAVADRLLEIERSAALPRLAGLRVTTRREELLGLAAARWAQRDAEQALAWARSMSPEDTRRSVLTSVGFQIAQTTPERALAVAEELPPGRDRWLLLGAIGRTWVARDANAAWTWARKLPPGEPREAALAGIEAGLGVAGSRGVAPPRAAIARDPEASSAMRVPGGDERAGSTTRRREEELRREFEQRLLASPVQAADWLSSLPAPDRSDEMIERLAREWLVTNPAAAEAWLDQNVPSEAWRRHLLDQAGAARGR